MGAIVDDKESFVVCMRVKDLPKSDIAGATKDKCHVCAEEVWISPATMKIKEERNASTVCMPCVIEQTKGAPLEFTADPRQIEEAMENIQDDILRN